MQAVQRREAPQPVPPPSGFLFNLRELRRDPLGLFARVARTRGDVARMRAGLRDVWLISYPDDIEQVLVVQRDAFIKDVVTRGLSDLLGEGLLTADGETWRRARSLCAPSFQPRQVAVYGEAMVTCASQGVPAPGVRDIHEDMTAITLEIVLRTLFGSVGSSAPTEQVGPALAELMEVFEQEQRTLWRFVPSWVPGPHRRRARRHIEALQAMVLDIIAERRRLPPGDDLLSRLIEARDEQGRGMDDVALRDQAITLFLAGHETTALALSYALWMLALHPEAQAAVHAELDALGRDPVADDLPRLVQTSAAVKETLRLYPPAWGIGRETVVPVEIGGQHIPAGTQVGILPWIVHRDARWWPRPERFELGRWLGDAPSERPRFAYLPFGGGPRVCIGNHFATMEAVLVLATLLRRIRVAPVPGFEPKLLPAVTLRSRNGVWVRVEARPLPA